MKDLKVPHLLRGSFCAGTDSDSDEIEMIYATTFGITRLDSSGKILGCVPVGAKVVSLSQSSTLSSSIVVASFEDGSIYLVGNEADFLAKIPHNVSCLDPYGNLVAIGSEDGTLRILSLDDGNVHSLKLKKSIVSLAWHPSIAYRLLVGEANGAVTVFDVSTMEPLQRFFRPKSYTETNACWSVDWSADGLIGMTVGDQWHVFTNSHLPIASGSSFSNDKCLIKWSLSHPKMFAILSGSHGLNVYSSIHNRVPTFIPLAARALDLSWHPTQPLLMVSTVTGLIFVSL